MVLWEHRNFVKKLVFPVETLPVNVAAAGVVTECIAARIGVTSKANSTTWRAGSVWL